MTSIIGYFLKGPYDCSRRIPDYSISVDKGLPTIILEVGVSQSAEDLKERAMGWLLGLGVQLAIFVDIQVCKTNTPRCEASTSSERVSITRSNDLGVGMRLRGSSNELPSDPRGPAEMHFKLKKKFAGHDLIVGGHHRIALVEPEASGSATTDPNPSRLIRYQFSGNLQSSSVEVDDTARHIFTKGIRCMEAQLTKPRRRP